MAESCKPLCPPSGGPTGHVQAYWDRVWSRAPGADQWAADQIPPELQRAIETGWFAPGGRVVDIGCGRGHYTAWLAARGFEALGIDFSPAVIAQAQALHRASAGALAFRVVDICRERDGVHGCDALFDRGCLQGVPRQLHPTYAATVASWVAPGARFLLLYGLHRGEPPAGSGVERKRADSVDHLEALFGSCFRIEGMDAIDMPRPSPQPAVPGLALWMTRI